MSLGAISTGTSVFWNFGGAFSGLSGGQQTEYKNAWNWFEIVQNSNARISTLGTFQFVKFRTNEERQQFILGQYLHQQVYPTNNFQSFPNR